VQLLQEVISNKVTMQKSIIESVVEENIGNSDNSNEYSPIEERSMKVNQLSRSNDKKLNRDGHETPSSNTVSRVESSFMNAIKSSVQHKKSKNKVMKSLEPSATLKMNRKTVSSPSRKHTLQNSYQMRLNSPNLKASYLENPIHEDGRSKSIASSSKISSSEISQSGSKTPGKKSEDKV
jgi:hypothetical protein